MKDLYTNMRPLWQPPGARGLYGGGVIAQCLEAAQHTVPDDFLVHSMHCYFVLAGSSSEPVIYYVERVREGRSFATRTVQARQRGKVIFTTTLSFQKVTPKSIQTLDHDSRMPEVGPPCEDKTKVMWVGHGPFVTQHPDPIMGDRPEHLRSRSWLRTRGEISAEGGQKAHTVALAYMTDSYFIGTVARAHRLWRSRPSRKRHERNDDSDVEIGMMVSMDHTIYFHRPQDFRADDWLFTEMETPWSGDGRGLVMQKIWTRDGRHIATCFQEVRMTAVPASLRQLTNHNRASLGLSSRRRTSCEMSEGYAESTGGTRRRRGRHRASQKRRGRASSS